MDQRREDARLKLRSGGHWDLMRAEQRLRYGPDLEADSFSTLVVMVDGLHSPSVLGSEIEIQVELDRPTLLELMVPWGA